MDHDVYISIKGLHQVEDMDGNDHEIEMVSTGHYYKRNGLQCVSYTEQFGVNDNPVKALVKIEDGALTVSRSGDMAGHLQFEAGRRSQSYFETPFGVMEMGVTTQDLQMKLEEHNWHIKVNYALDINNQYSGEHEVVIKVQDTKGHRDIRLV
ncbi:MAG: DUF1934 domain-containing protein [Firmicutes bacterium]|nr:DUF1934 domain-containing protein [Bacillota bacterium]